MFNELNHQNEEKIGAYKRKPQKKITQQRLKNIALYYLKRFESSVENLRQVLQKRINAYAKENPDFNKHQAYEWTEQILADFERLHYLDDRRFAEIKIRAYLSAGKPERYIKPKLKQKGISEQIIEEIEEFVESCKYQPLSTTKIVVNKEELEELPARVDIPLNTVKTLSKGCTVPATFTDLIG